ncbi:ComEC/Rec2 family competence protein [Cellulomonas rhizosphaerae]|uniref:ComEC/Rec2 family competence protein n=1 Tax=Cellulomonas rhizosphaerae TaxID=2293719 RepID=A0A413RQ36_9CELL|nr:ComEC/Rec2 family competence protein [Cellulomonas rhizosphaerae]RHA44067.1 ComEC/Rec2 family competence protein [Cellulomonas rhizosphaerae]
MTAAVLHATAHAPDERTGPPARRTDLRLFPALGTAWAAATVVVRVEARTALVVAALGLALALGLAALVVVRSRGDSGAGSTLVERCAGAVVMALVVAIVTLAAGAAQVASRDSGPWARLDAAPVRVEGRVTGDALRLPPPWPGAPEQAMWAMTTSTVESVGDHAVRQRARAPIRVMGPAREVPPFDAVVVVVGRLRTEPRGDRAVATILVDDDVVVLHGPPPWQRTAQGVRAAEHRLAAPLPRDVRALLPGVTVGDTSGVPDDLRDALRASGLTHLTAVSGAHFSLVAMLALVVAGLLRVPRRARAGVVVVAMAAMVILVHPSPSVVRAAVMGLVGVWAMLLGRPAGAPAALAAAVVVLLVLDPWLAGEIGFVLSVLATAGIVLIAQPLTRRWSGRAGRSLAAALAVPVAAQVVCGPVVVVLTPAFATYAIPANILAAPAVAPATAAGVVEPWCAPVATVLAWVAGAACWWIGAVARLAAAAPGAQLAWLPGALGVGVLGLSGLCVLRLLLPQREQRVRDQGGGL